MKTVCISVYISLKQHATACLKFSLVYLHKFGAPFPPLEFIPSQSYGEYLCHDRPTNLLTTPPEAAKCKELRVVLRTVVTGRVLVIVNCCKQEPTNLLFGTASGRAWISWVINSDETNVSAFSFMPINDLMRGLPPGALSSRTAVKK